MPRSLGLIRCLEGHLSMLNRLTEPTLMPMRDGIGTVKDVNSCLTRDGGHRYHILFDNEEEGRDLREKNVLHRLDYDKLFNHK